MKIKYHILLRDIGIIIICFLFSLFAMILADLYCRVNYIKFIIIIFSAFSLSFWLHAFFLFLHESAHFNIHSNKRINDLLANVLFVPVFGIDVKSYRKYHWQHHLYLGKINDTEHSYFTDVSAKNLFLSFIIPTFPVLEKIVSENKNNNKSFSIYKIQNLAISLLFHFSIVFVTYLNNLKLSSFFYLISITNLFPMIAKLRQKLEHRNENADSKTDYKFYNHGEYNRNFKNNFFSKYFGAAGFNRHYLHHLNPKISYTNFDEYEKEIQKNNIELYEKIKNSEQEYSKIFFKLLKF